MDTQQQYNTNPNSTRPEHTMRTTVAPTIERQRVRFTSYGGNIKQYHVGMTGTVVRFTRSGNPVIRLDATVIAEGRYNIGGHVVASPDVTDTYGCAKALDGEGKVAFVTVACR